jgi:epsilon-lactone hydrolase
MASIRSRLYVLAIRVWTRWAFRPGMTLAKMRLLMQSQDRRNANTKVGDIDKLEVETPVRGRWLRNGDMPGSRVFLYLHGGAFIVRMPESHSVMVSRLCHATGFSAFLPWYRLAPEHPFPAALEDCFSAYQMLLSEYPPDNIVIAGDSAGGNLTLSLLNLIKERQVPMPRAAIALSPITDFLQICATWLLRQDPMFPMQQFVAPQRHYLKGKDLMNPLASPLYGNLSGLPPVLIVAGSIEALRDDAVAYVRKAIDAGVDARVHIWQGMPHVHTLMSGLPEAAPTEQRMVEWLNSRLEEGASSRSESWETAVTWFNRAPIVGRITASSNGEQVRRNLQEMNSFV